MPRVSTEEAIRIVQELNGRTCRCGKPKGKEKTFCPSCYSTLPREMQLTLYKRVGKGYEEAYQACVKHLTSRKSQSDNNPISR